MKIKFDKEINKYNTKEAVKKSMSTAYHQDDREIFVENIKHLIHK